MCKIGPAVVENMGSGTPLRADDYHVKQRPGMKREKVKTTGRKTRVP